jgi:hypothetical protein
MHFDLTPIGLAVLASFAVGQHRPLGCDDDAGNSIQRDAAHPGWKDIDLLQKRLGGSHPRTEQHQTAGEDRFHRYIEGFSVGGRTVQA